MNKKNGMERSERMEQTEQMKHREQLERTEYGTERLLIQPAMDSSFALI